MNWAGKHQAGQEGYEFHFGGTGFSDFFESLFGEGRFGQGRTGRTHVPTKGEDIEGDIMITLDEAFHGSTRSITVRKSQGSEETYKIKIPAGVESGSRIRLGGKGEAGSGRAEAGDLYLRVRVAPHPYFRLEGPDLIYDLELSPWEAVLGNAINFPTLDQTLKLKIPPGTQNGQRFRLRGQGFPRLGKPRGDLIVQIHVEVPESVTPAEKKAWEELVRVSSFNPRK
jgi:curved DNA-binding protein